MKDRLALNIAFNGVEVPLPRTLYERADLDSRFGTGFTAYLDIEQLISHCQADSANPDSFLIARYLDCSCEPLRIQISDEALKNAIISTENRHLKFDLVQSALLDEYKDIHFPLNTFKNSWESFNPSIAAKSDPVSSHGYSGVVDEFLSAFRDDQIIVDIGCGLRQMHFSNIINCEIFDYPSTDILCSGDCLPFKSESVDAVLSLAVLEHVADPFLNASEITRILKPGGKLLLKLPFLQAEHGYPHHYFNATRQGVLQLFKHLDLESQFLDKADHPINTLTQVASVYLSGLPSNAGEAFLDLKIRDLFLLADPLRKSELETNADLLEFSNPDVPWLIASGTTTIFHKS